MDNCGIDKFANIYYRKDGTEAVRYKEEIHNYVQNHRNEIINMLKELVKIPSIQSKPEEGAPFGRACAEVLEYVKSCWQKNGFDTEIHQNDGYLLSYYGEGEKSIGLFSHADAVNVSDDWVFTEPFNMIEKEGFLIGRGVSDDKASIVISLYCAKMHKELDIPFNSKLVVFTGVNEETGMKDIENYVKENTPPDFALVTDCAFPIYRGDKGIFQFEAVSDTPFKEIEDFSGGKDINITLGKATAKINNNEITEIGVSCHGALPEGSVNAGYLLAKRLCDENLLCNEDMEQMKIIRRLLKKYYGEVFGIEGEDRIFGKLTCSNSIIKTEDGRPALIFDVRYGLDMDYESIKNKISEFFRQNNWSVKIISEKRPYIISEDNVYLQRCLKAYREFCKTDFAATYINAGATYAGALPCAVETGSDLYGGNPEGMPEGHGNGHQPDECISTNGFINAMELILHMVLEHK